MFLIRPDKYVIPKEAVHSVGGKLTVDAQALEQLLEANPSALEVVQGTWIAFTDFLAPSVWFIFGSIIIRPLFSVKTGLAKRTGLQDARRSSASGRACILSRLLRHDLRADPRHGSHRGRRGDLYPLLMAIYTALRRVMTTKPTRFGKEPLHGHGLRGRGREYHVLCWAPPAAPWRIGFYKEIVGREDIGFFEPELLHATCRLGDDLHPVGRTSWWLLQARATDPSRASRRTSQRPSTPDWGR